MVENLERTEQTQQEFTSEWIAEGWSAEEADRAWISKKAIAMLNNGYLLREAPQACLSNGLVVCNYSSGHSFHFVDGTVLDGCHHARVQALALHRPDEVFAHHEKKFRDILPGFALTPIALAALIQCSQQPKVDIVIVPRVILEVLERFRFTGQYAQAVTSKCRTIIKDRRDTLEGPGLCRIDEFGVVVTARPGY